MCVAWFAEIKRRPSEPSAKGNSDGPLPPYPTDTYPGRRHSRFVLPRRRRLPQAQPARAELRDAQEALGFGSPDPRPLAAVARHRERAFLLARHPEVLLAPVPRSPRPSPLLHPSSLHRRVRKLGRFLEPLRRTAFPSWWANPRHSSSTRRCLGGVAPTPGGRFGGL